MAEVHEIRFIGADNMMGGGTPGISAMESDDREKNAMKNYGKLLKDNTSGFWKKIGIDLSIRSMLKQSQIFTATIGSFFQIVGAFIDVILAPFMPFIIPVIRKLASWIPDIHKAARQIFNIVNWGVQNILRPLWGGLKNVLGTLVKVLPESWQKGLKSFFGSPQWKLLIVLLIAAAGTKKGRGMYASAFRGARTEAGMVSAFGPRAVAGMRAGQITGGAGRAGGALAAFGRGKMGGGMKAAGGLGVAMGAAGAVGDIAGGNTKAGILGGIGAGAMGVGMMFGPIGMVVGMLINILMQVLASKARNAQQQAGADPGAGGGSPLTVSIQDRTNANSVSFAAAVNTVNEREGYKVSTGVEAAPE